MYVCLCHPLTDKKLRQMVQTGEVRTVAEVAQKTRAGTGCGMCACDIKRILREEQECQPDTLAAK